jgi:hypothetical protein|tara:strand:+ start:3119 stop:3367 length:249 start_codon:yes stop_codon:yes gene_type:complete
MWFNRVAVRLSRSLACRAGANLEKSLSDTEDAMPTLFRLLVAIAFVVGLAYAGMFALAVLVEPNEREVTVRVPTRDLLADTP